MVVRAARGERETGTQRTLSLCRVAARTLSEDLGTRGRGTADRVRGTHPAWTTGLCRCLGAHLAARRVLRPRDPRTPTPGCHHSSIPRRTSTEERTSRAQKREMQVSIRSAGLANPPRVRTAEGIPNLPLRLPGLAEGPPRQVQHPVGADAVKGPASGCAALARLHPGMKTHTRCRCTCWCLRLATARGRSRGRAWRTRALREGRLAPERQRWRLQPRTICARAEALTNLATPLPPGAASAGPGPASALWRRGFLAATGEGGRG